jgi:hypothetical protein
MTAFTVDSTKADEIRSPARYRSPCLMRLPAFAAMSCSSRLSTDSVPLAGALLLARSVCVRLARTGRRERHEPLFIDRRAKLAGTGTEDGGSSAESAQASLATFHHNSAQASNRRYRTVRISRVIAITAAIGRICRATSSLLTLCSGYDSSGYESSELLYFTVLRPLGAYVLAAMVAASHPLPPDASNCAITR